MDVVLTCPNCGMQIKARLKPGAIYTFQCDICNKVMQVSIGTKQEQPQPGPSEVKSEENTA